MTGKHLASIISVRHPRKTECSEHQADYANDRLRITIDQFEQSSDGKHNEPTHLHIYTHTYIYNISIYEKKKNTLQRSDSQYDYFKMKIPLRRSLVNNGKIYENTHHPLYVCLFFVQQQRRRRWQSEKM